MWYSQTGGQWYYLVFPAFSVLIVSGQYSGANVIKLFTVVSYEFSQKARVFVACKPFQDSIVFADKAGAYSSETSFRCSTLGQAPDLALKL